MFKPRLIIINLLASDRSAKIRYRNSIDGDTKLLLKFIIRTTIRTLLRDLRIIVEEYIIINNRKRY